jgi:hypothetical protein
MTTIATKKPSSKSPRATKTTKPAPSGSLAKTLLPSLSARLVALEQEYDAIASELHPNTDAPNLPRLKLHFYWLASYAETEAMRTKSDAAHHIAARAWELLHLASDKTRGPDVDTHYVAFLASRIAASPTMREIASKGRGDATSNEIVADALRAHWAYVSLCSAGERAANVYVPSRAFFVAALEKYAAERKAAA